MQPMNRREFGVALSAVAAMCDLAADAQTPQATEDDPALKHSEIVTFAKLPVKTSPNGMTTRAVLHGTLATGEFVEVHETTLPPGERPHPPHRHTHSEFLLVRDGKLEVESDGKTGTVTAGDVVFTASAVLHGLTNTGDRPASYFVVAVGVQKAIL